MFGAAPLLLAAARFWTGECWEEVKYSVNHPIQSPDQRPSAVHMKAYNGVTYPPSYTFLNSKCAGSVQIAQ